MLSFELIEKMLYFVWDDDECLKGIRYSAIKIPSWIPNSSVITVAEALRVLCIRGAESSYTYTLKAGKLLFEHIEKGKLKFPPAPDAWSNFILSHFESHLSNTNTSFKTRIQNWCIISRLYKKLQRSSFIPYDVYIPNEPPSLGTLADNIEQPLGHERITHTTPERLDCLLPKKYLIESDLSLSDDAYLLGLKRTLDIRAATVLHCCVDYWERMLRCHSRGRDYYESISDDEIKLVLQSQNYYRNGIHLANPNSPEGMKWFLSVAFHYAQQAEDLEILNFKELGKIPFFKSVIRNARTRPVIRSAIRDLTDGDGINPHQLTEALHRLLGFLSPRDCAVACAILATENPCFNASSLTNVRLYSQNGTLYLRGNSETNKITFSVSKPRARDRKVSILPALSIRIINDVVRCTTLTRQRLKDARKSGWRKLFLFSTRAQFGRTARFNAYLSSAKGTTLHHLYRKELAEVGIKASMLTLHRIRCTQGILQFLRTGSIQAAADALGNTAEVVRNNYIPKWMENRWATRRIRILHQKFIAVATEGKPWQLAASDFTTTEELQEFIRRTLLGLNKGDALSEAIRSKLGHYAPEEDSLFEMFTEREILLNRSPLCFAAIYAYADAVNLLPPENRHLIDSSTDLPLWIFPAIKNLITQTTNIDFDTSTNAEISVADRISGDSLSEIKKTHIEATKLAERIKAQITFKI